MDDIAEKRVFDSRSGETWVFLATGLGVVRVSVSDDRIGRFGVDLPGATRDVSVWNGHLVAATEDDVIVRTDDGYAPLEFGPAATVGVADDRLLAADPDGRIARRSADDDRWTTIGRIDVPVRDIDGDLVAAADGVYRIDPVRRSIDHVGLDDVAAVSSVGVPLAATATGLFRLGNGWMESHPGDFRTIAVDPRAEPGSIDGTHVAGESGFLSYTDGGWVTLEPPADASIVAIALEGSAPGTAYAVTENGSLLLRTADGLDPGAPSAPGGSRWAVQHLGLHDVAAIAVFEPES